MTSTALATTGAMLLDSIPLSSKHFNADGLLAALAADFSGASGAERYSKPFPILGPELVTNGGFDDASGWALGLGSAISDGALKASAPEAINNNRRPIDVADGDFLRVSFTVSNHVSGTVRVLAYDATTAAITPLAAADGDYAHDVMVTSDATAFPGDVVAQFASGTTLDVDNISVRKIIGYRSVHTGFEDIFDHSLTGLATMVDHDGKLKWGPHNLVTKSEDFLDPTWITDDFAPSGTTTVAPDGSTVPGYSFGTYGFFYQDSPVPPKIGEVRKNVVWIRANKTGTIGLRKPGVDVPDSVPIELSEEWQRFEIENVASSTTGRFLLDNRTVNTFGTPGLIIYMWHLSQHRSDLGGMVNNPDTGDSYVPTTDSPRYLARRGHHVSKWATHNLVLWSEDFANAAWVDGSISGGSRVDGALSVSSSEGYAYAQQALSVTTGVPHTIEVDVTCDAAVADVPLRAGLGSSNDASLVDFDAGETKRVAFSVTPTSGTLTIGLDARNAVVPGGSDATGYKVTLANASVYRSDLGGMVEGYVPTGATAVQPTRTLVNAGLLIESEARTNLLPYGSDIYGMANYAGATRTAGPLSPDGVTPWSLVSFTASADRVYPTTASVAAGATVCGSAFIDASQSTDGTIDLYVGLSGSNRQRLPVTISGNTLTYDPPITGGVEVDPAGEPTLENLGGGLYRVALAATNSATGARDFTVGLWGTSSTGTMTVAFWGCQLEAGLTPSSYMPTDGSPFTRPAETLTIPAANLPFHPDGVWVSMRGLYTAGDRDQAFEVMPYLWEQDASNKVFAYLRSDLSPSLFQFRQYEAGNSDHVTSGEYPLGMNVAFSIAARHGPAYVNGAVNGVALTANSTPLALANLSSADMQLAPTFMGCISGFAMGSGNPGDSGTAAVS